MRAALDVRLYDVPIATLHDADRGVEWVWRAAAAQRWGLGARIVSNILPVLGEGQRALRPAVRALLTGLLPEGNVRSHMAFDAGVASDDVFGMLSAYGRDTAGALTFRPQAGPAFVERLEALTDEDVARMLTRALDGSSPEGFQSTSLAGVQPKIALAHDTSGLWSRCVNGAPSTHILKVGHPPGSGLADLIDTEAACLALAQAVGLGSVSATIQQFGQMRALVITRYDRERQPDGSIRRIHQEDAAQALGLDTSDPDRKFQFGKRLPSLHAIAEVLRASGVEPDALMRLTAFNVAVGNTDAHAKNLGIIRPATGPARLADAYDVSMHGHHPLSSGRSAIDINGKQRLGEITAVDLEAEARSWGLPTIRAARAVGETLVKLDHSLAALERDHFPGVPEVAWSTVERRVRELLGG